MIIMSFAAPDSWDSSTKRVIIDHANVCFEFDSDSCESRLARVSTAQDHASSFFNKIKSAYNCRA